MGMEIHACWNVIPATGHYFRNCISRRIGTFPEYDLFLASFRRSGGLDGVCECFYGSCFVELQEKAEPCYYMRRGENENISHTTYIKYLKDGRLTCLCPDTLCIEIGMHVCD